MNLGEVFQETNSLLTFTSEVDDANDIAFRWQTPTSPPVYRSLDPPTTNSMPLTTSSTPSTTSSTPKALEPHRSKTFFVAHKKMPATLDKEKKKVVSPSKRAKKQMEKTNLESAIMIVKDYTGRWLVMGSPDLENLLLEGKPIIDVTSQTLYSYKDADAELSFENAAPPAEVKSPLKLPLPLQNTVPGGVTIKDIVAARVTENLAPTKTLVRGVSKVQNVSEIVASPKSKKQRRIIVVTAKSTQKIKRKYTKASSFKQMVRETSDEEMEQLVLPGQSTYKPSSSGASTIDMSDMVCSFGKCGKKWKVAEKEGERWILCDHCTNWACSTCSWTVKLNKEAVSMVAFKCEGWEEITLITTLYYDVLL